MILLTMMTLKGHTRIPGLWTQVLDAGIWILNSGRWILDAEIFTIGARGWWLKLDCGRKSFKILLSKALETIGIYQ